MTRGPELKNAIMTEYMSLIGIGRRFGTPWRPMEQGLVEGMHVQTQRILGMLVKDVMRCFPNEVGELYHVVEFIVYNTPGAHGFTPRDVDRRWSVSSPLERELQPFQVGEFEPINSYVSNLYKAYRDVRVRVLAFLKQSADKRAELANRWRRHKEIRPGASVVLQDPRHRRAGGRIPYKRPLSDPCEVIEVHGNKMTAGASARAAAPAETIFSSLLGARADRSLFPLICFEQIRGRSHTAPSDGATKGQPWRSWSRSR